MCQCGCVHVCVVHARGVCIVRVLRGEIGKGSRGRDGVSLTKIASRILSISFDGVLVVFVLIKKAFYSLVKGVDIVLWHAVAKNLEKPPICLCLNTNKCHKVRST